MPKTYSEHERRLIREKLIDACEQCWNRYGYQKTGIRELTALANVSTGAFYQFFDSKEMAFVAAADQFQGRLVGAFHDIMRLDPSKHGLARGVKTMIAMTAAAPWVAAMWEDWPIIARKLPPDFVEENFHRDVTQIASIIEQYRLVARQDEATVTQIVEILLTSLTRVVYMPGPTTEAVDFIVDAVIDQLFQ